MAKISLDFYVDVGKSFEPMPVSTPYLLRELGASDMPLGWKHELLLAACGCRGSPANPGSIPQSMSSLEGLDVWPGASETGCS